MKKESINEQCTSCDGTGLYSGFCEGKGEAVICCYCAGQGWVRHVYTPFKGRKKKKAINKIRHSRGTFVLTGVGGYGEEMTYEDFEKKYPVKNNGK